MNGEAAPCQSGHASGLPTRRRVLAVLGMSLLNVAFPALAATPAGGAARRTALVIGNAAYRNARLKNPVNDAQLMERTLRGLGYAVSTAFDVRLDRMIDASRRWIADSTAADVRLFYYAGHAVQSRGRNFLIPVDGEATSEEQVAAAAFNVTDVIERLSRFESGVNIVVLDACRNWPFSSSGSARGRGGLAGNASGLAPVGAPRGTLVAYSTAPGLVAADGGDAANSVYTRNLAEQMRAAGIPVETVFKQVRSAVMQETSDIQVPWESSSLVGEFCFQVDASGGCGQARR